MLDPPDPAGSDKTKISAAFVPNPNLDEYTKPSTTDRPKSRQDKKEKKSKVVPADITIGKPLTSVKLAEEDQPKQPNLVSSASGFVTPAAGKTSAAGPDQPTNVPIPDGKGGWLGNEPTYESEGAKVLRKLNKKNKVAPAPDSKPVPSNGETSSVTLTTSMAPLVISHVVAPMTRPSIEDSGPVKSQPNERRSNVTETQWGKTKTVQKPRRLKTRADEVLFEEQPDLKEAKASLSAVEAVVGILLETPDTSAHVKVKETVLPVGAERKLVSEVVTTDETDKGQLPAANQVILDPQNEKEKDTLVLQSALPVSSDPRPETPKKRRKKSKAAPLEQTNKDPETSLEDLPVLAKPAMPVVNGHPKSTVLSQPVLLKSNLEPTGVIEQKTVMVKQLLPQEPLTAVEKRLVEEKHILPQPDAATTNPVEKPQKKSRVKKSDVKVAADNKNAVQQQDLAIQTEPAAVESPVVLLNKNIVLESTEKNNEAETLSTDDVQKSKHTKKLKKKGTKKDKRSLTENDEILNSPTREPLVAPNAPTKDQVKPGNYVANEEEPAHATKTSKKPKSKKNQIAEPEPLAPPTVAPKPVVIINPRKLDPRAITSDDILGTKTLTPKISTAITAVPSKTPLSVTPKLAVQPIQAAVSVNMPPPLPKYMSDDEIDLLKYEKAGATNNRLRPGQQKKGEITASDQPKGKPPPGKPDLPGPVLKPGFQQRLEPEIPSVNKLKAKDVVTDADTNDVDSKGSSKKRKKKKAIKTAPSENEENEEKSHQKKKKKKHKSSAQGDPANEESGSGGKRGKKKKNKNAEGTDQQLENSSKRPVDELYGQSVGNFFILEDVLGKGGFGEARRGHHITSTKKFAIKLERTPDGNDSLAEEYRIYQILGQHVGFPRCYYFGIGPQNHNALVMDLLGPSLEDYFRAMERKWSLKTICMAALQILERIEYMHSKGFVYSDIKPENFLVGLHEDHLDGVIYLIDFGLAQQFKDKDTGKYCYDENMKTHPVGTMRYMSVRSHEARSLSYRDDLESIGYLVIYFIRGRLPWQGMGIKDRQKKVKAVGLKKKSLRLEELCQECPAELQEYMKYVRSIQFYAEPKYERLRSFFTGLMAAHDWVDDGQFDWIGQKYDFSKNKKSESNVGKKCGEFTGEEDTGNATKGPSDAETTQTKGTTKSPKHVPKPTKKPVTPTSAAAVALGAIPFALRDKTKVIHLPTGMDPTVDPLLSFNTGSRERDRPESKMLAKQKIKTAGGGSCNCC